MVEEVELSKNIKADDSDSNRQRIFNTAQKHRDKHPERFGKDGQLLSLRDRRQKERQAMMNAGYQYGGRGRK